MAPVNKVPTGRPIKSPMITSMMLGGIKIPSVPAEAIVPTAKDLLYPLESITGKAMSVSIMTDAPTMPVVAAMIVPSKVTAIARPPGIFASINCKMWSKSSATPLFSSMVPINTNMGTATRTGFWAACPQIRGKRLAN